MLALARRYRPKRFADLLVQDHVAAVLRGAVARGRVGHGYLLTGPRGVGKTTAARILAMALNCPNARAVGRALRRVRELPPDLERRRPTSTWSRSTRRATAGWTTRASCGSAPCTPPRRQGHHKVYIVDEAHMLTREAWNALLKILEEPPPGVVFVFATTEPQKIAATAAPVLSRLQRFDFRRIGPAAIRDRLRQVLDAEGIAADDDALTLIARHADGGMRDALSVLDQCLSFGEGAVTAERVREVLGLVDDELYAEVLATGGRPAPGGGLPAGGPAGGRGSRPGRVHGRRRRSCSARCSCSSSGTAPEGLTEALRQDARALPGPARAGGRGADAAPAGRERGRDPPKRQPPAGGRDAAAALGDDGSDGGPARRCWRGGGGRGRRAGGAGGAAGRRRGRSRRPAGRASPETRSPARRGAGPRLGHRRRPRRAAARRTGRPRPGIAEAWPAIVAAVRSQSRFLGEALAATTPAPVEGSWLPLVMAEPNPLFAERIQAEAAAVEEVVGRAHRPGARASG